MVLSDLYSSTSFGPLYHYINIQGFINRSILFSQIKRITLISGLLIFLHRTHNLIINLGMYLVSWWSVELSALNLIEFFLILGLILRLFESVLKLWTIRDRHLSIFNEKDNNLFWALPKGEKFYFRLGVAIYSVSSRLKIIGQVIFIYLILCQLDLISSFIRVDQFFDFIDYILDYILKLWGFVLILNKIRLPYLLLGKQYS